jgi:hypothetical protein
VVAHREDLGDVREPRIAGNPLRLDVIARSSSGHVGSLSVVDLSGATDIRYAIFNMSGDLPVGSPAFVKSVGSGITVTSATGGAFSVFCGSADTALWRGRDWHAARFYNSLGEPFELFDGYVVSTVALSY